VKIVLATQHADAAFTPLALLYLKAFASSAVHLGADAFAVLEFPAGAAAADIADAVLAEQPDVVGLSCYVWNVRTLTAACGTIKARRHGVRVVLGGPEVGPVADAVLRAHPSVDVIVRSEGERPFAELLARWMDGRSIDDVAGIAFRCGAAIRDTGDAPILQDLDELPSPHLASRDDFTRRVICLETQRGCVFRCNFCFYNKDLSIRNRRFDLDRVQRELARWLAEDVDEIYLMDPIFNLHAARAKEICRFIAAHNARRIGIHAEVWAEFIDEELAALMRDANVTFLEVGLQSTDQTTLATVERRLRLQKFLDGVAHITRAGIPWELQLIFGLPGDTRASFRRSLNFAMSLDPPELAVYPLMVLPGTELWRKAGALQLAFDPEPPYHVRSHYSMSEDDVRYGWRVVRALQDLGDSRTLRLLARERGLSYADVVDAWIAWEDENPGLESTGYRVKHFLLEFCAQRQIAADVYRTSASWEFAG
jgi:radical SAM superfamily enzyme YgiQ (UPF0313 family)